MELNLITDKQLLTLCNYASSIGLKSYPEFKIDEFAVKQISLSADGFLYNLGLEKLLTELHVRKYSGKQMRCIEQQLLKFKQSNIKNKDIERLGFNIHLSKDGDVVLNFLLSYKCPPFGDIENFIACFKNCITGFKFKWDENIEFSGENMMQFSVDVLDRYGVQRNFRNPLNTRLQNFSRLNLVCEGYMDKFISYILRMSKATAIYIKQDKLPYGHSLITFLSK